MNENLSSGIGETVEERPTKHSKQHRRTVVIGFSCVAIALLAIGIIPRISARNEQAAQVDRQRELTVSVIEAARAPRSQELLLPGSVTPWADAAIYARTSGYVQRWLADIGAEVKAGQTLVQIDTPELDAELKQARADEATARANYNFSKTTAQRWNTMLQTQSVAQQDADSKSSDAAAKLAALQAAQANVARLQELVGYQVVTAPFSGIITVRNVQVGALVTAGGTPGLATMPGELFHIVKTDRLRVYIDVPQDDSSQISPATAVWLSTQQYPGRRFAGTVARSSNAIDPVSRTMHVEVDIDNADGALKPGSYAQVHLALTTASPALQLPVSTLLFRPDGVTVAVVDAHEKVELRKVTIGRDFGTYVEVTTGIAATDCVINNPGDAITNGEAVRIQTKATTNGKA